MPRPDASACTRTRSMRGIFINDFYARAERGRFGVSDFDPERTLAL
jgi:hypothetical protein